MTEYRISLRGPVPDRVIEVYSDEFTVARSATRTTMQGPVIDPAHLHGIVAHLTALGLELVEVAIVTSDA